jgi:hypothetical protein
MLEWGCKIDGEAYKSKFESSSGVSLLPVMKAVEV